MAETAEERQQLRAGLLDQLRHLVREVDMLEGVIGRVPEKLLAETPPGEDRSIKETFALIARLDEAVHARRIERVVAEDTPRFTPPDREALLSNGEDWNAQSMAALFERVRTARREPHGSPAGVRTLSRMPGRTEGGLLLPQPLFYRKSSLAPTALGRTPCKNLD